MWSELFQPHLVIVMKPAFIVIDEDRSRDMHGVDQTKTVAHPAFADEFLNLRSNVDESTSAWYLEPEMFGERFHDSYLQPENSMGATGITDLRAKSS